MLMVVYSNNDNIESEENISKIKFNFYHGRKIPFAKLKQRLTKKRIIKKSTLANKFKQKNTNCENLEIDKKENFNDIKFDDENKENIKDV